MRKALILIFVFLISLNYVYSNNGILLRETFDSSSNASLNTDTISDGMIALSNSATYNNNPSRLIQNITGTVWQGDLRNTTWNWQQGCDDSDIGSTFHGPQLVVNNIATPSAGGDWIWEIRSENTDCQIRGGNWWTGGGDVQVTLFTQTSNLINISLFQNWSDSNDFLVWNVYTNVGGVMTKQGNFSTKNTEQGAFINWAHENVLINGQSKMDNLTVCNVTKNRPNFGCGGFYNTSNEPSPLNITYYNLSDSSGCEVWNTNKNSPCNTTDPTPQVQFDTNEAAWCAIAASTFGTMDKNYSYMGALRNCTGASSGEGSTEHVCSVIQQDEITYEESYIYISCKDESGNQNRTSTSGALNISVSLEANAKNVIEQGIRNALLSGYTTYTDQKIYARNSANNQAVGKFDKVAKKLNKIWAFNRIGSSESHVNMFNITPTLYSLEFANKSQEYIENKTTELINATR